MSERKKQVWLRHDQVDLVVACLRHVQSKLKSESPLSAVHAMAGQYTSRRIDEVLELFVSQPTNDVPRDD
jgi:hypothetical protein